MLNKDLIHSQKTELWQAFLRHQRMMVSAMLLFIITLVSAQNRTITGTVTDATGEAVIAATIMVKGTTTGAATDLDGKYLRFPQVLVH